MIKGVLPGGAIQLQLERVPSPSRHLLLATNAPDVLNGDTGLVHATNLDFAKSAIHQNI